jgi:hypothetical protein
MIALPIVREITMRGRLLAALLATACPLTAGYGAKGEVFTISPQQTLEAPGVSVIVDHNKWSPIFFDEKNAGIQIVLHGQRIAVDGDVRLNPTPEQWDPVPTFIDRSVDAKADQVIVRGAYPDVQLNYRIRVAPEGDGFRIAVDLDKPLPEVLQEVARAS